MSRAGFGRSGAFVAGIVVLGSIVGAPGSALAQDPGASPVAEGREVVVSLGAVDELFRDDFATTANWGLYDDTSASIDGEEGGLRFRLRTDNQSRWNWHTLDAATPVMRFGVNAAFDPGVGAAGPMCGSAGDAPSFFAGVVNLGGEWVLGRIVANQFAVIARDLVPGLDLSEGGTVKLEIECAVTGDPGDRVAFFVNGVNVADVVDTSSIGPFDKGGLFAEVATGPFEVIFDDALILGGAAYDPRMALGPGPGASLEPSPPPSAGPLVSLGATTLELEEPFDDETVWAVMKNDQGSIAYDEGTLRVTLRPSDHTLSSVLALGVDAPVLGVDASVLLDPGQGGAGPMCGSATGGSSLYYAALTPAGQLILGVVVNGEKRELQKVPPAGGTEPVPGAARRVRIECAVTDGGTDRVAAWVDEQLIADITTATSIAPFSKAGIMGANAKRRWSAAFEEVVVRSGAVYAPQGGEPEVSPAATVEPSPSRAPSTPLPVGALLDAVPEAFRADCRTAAADAATGQLESVLCAPAGSAASAEYYRYESLDALQAAFDRFVTLGGADRSGTDCTTASAVVDYTIGGQPAGQLACYDAARGRGVTVQWSNRDLLVLAFGTDASGSYADALTWWQNAGPIP